LLPGKLAGLRLRHALEVRHASFRCVEFVEIARRHRVATVFADTDDYPSFADASADFIYARLMRCTSDCPTGYPRPAIVEWAERARTWSAGADPAGLPTVAPATPAGEPRDVFVYFISGAKERAPAAAVALISAIGPVASGR